MTGTYLKIGELSQQTEVAVGALRYYESRGLLKPQRRDNGYRYYPTVAVAQVKFIKKAQSLGFSLKDIGEILNVHRQGDLPCHLVRSLLQDKINQLETQIHNMQALKAGLEDYRNQWAIAPRPQPGEICPLIETIPLPQDAELGVATGEIAG